MKNVLVFFVLFCFFTWKATLNLVWLKYFRITLLQIHSIQTTAEIKILIVTTIQQIWNYRTCYNLMSSMNHVYYECQSQPQPQTFKSNSISLILSFSTSTRKSNTYTNTWNFSRDRACGLVSFFKPLESEKDNSEYANIEIYFQGSWRKGSRQM